VSHRDKDPKQTISERYDKANRHKELTHPTLGPLVDMGDHVKPVRVNQPTLTNTP